jgi:hypothetical protein
MMIEAGEPPASALRAEWWRSRRWMPFWVLQASELALAVVFADLSIHVAHGGILIGAAVALFLLAITADGPLGIFRIVRRTQHAHLAVVVAVVFAVAVWLPSVHADSEEKVVVIVASIGLIRVATLTRTTASDNRRRSRGDRQVVQTTATVATPDPQSPALVEPDTADSTIRKAGRTTGAAAAAGKRAVDEHRPAVEDQVKRGFRSAGRLAGRLTGPRTPPDQSA